MPEERYSSRHQAGLTDQSERRSGFPWELFLMQCLRPRILKKSQESQSLAIFSERKTREYYGLVSVHLVPDPEEGSQ